MGELAAKLNTWADEKHEQVFGGYLNSNFRWLTTLKVLWSIKPNQMFSKGVSLPNLPAVLTNRYGLTDLSSWRYVIFSWIINRLLLMYFFHSFTLNISNSSFGCPVSGSHRRTLWFLLWMSALVSMKVFFSKNMVWVSSPKIWLTFSKLLVYLS